MSKIERYAGNLRAFGSNAQGLERTLFGETTQADDLTSQVTAAFLRGWGIVGPSENPSLEDFNAAMYAMSQFIAYQHQMGIPEWDAAQEYYTGSLCVRGGETYSSLADNNIGSAPPSAKWTPVLTSKNGLANLGLGDLAKQNAGNVNITGGSIRTTVGSLYDGSNRVYSDANPGATFSSDGVGLWFNVKNMLQVRIGAWSLGSAAGATVPITFVQAFTRGCLIVVPIPDISANDQIGVLDRHLTGATLSKGNADTSPRSGQYIAFGY